MVCIGCVSFSQNSFSLKVSNSLDLDQVEKIVPFDLDPLTLVVTGTYCELLTCISVVVSIVGGVKGLKICCR